MTLEVRRNVRLINVTGIRLLNFAEYYKKFMADDGENFM
jgi:hypothetical protein